MNADTHTELFYLTLLALVTAMMWVPYILNSFVVRGIMGTMANPSADAKPLSDWAQRLQAAHKNAIENLVVFAALVLTANAVDISNDVTTAAAITFFWARIAHYVIYGAGIPVLRTVAFLIGWACLVAIAMQLLP